MNENTKDAYKQKFQAKIQKWEGQLEQLRNKANSASADAKIEISKKIEQLQGQKDDMKQKVSNIGDIAGGAWDALKEEMDKAGESFQAAIKDTIEKLK